VSDVEQVIDRPNYVVFEFSAIAWIIVHRSGRSGFSAAELILGFFAVRDLG